MLETAEIVQTIERLESELADLAVRGLRSVGTKETKSLEMLREEFERIGAAHLTERIAQLMQAIETDEGAGVSLMKTQASLRVFERILTLESVEEQLQSLVPEAMEELDEDEV